jgi:NTP pyrophosphatase (non-canonical NTP hydrolase)
MAMKETDVGREIAEQRARNHVRFGAESIEDRPPDYAGWLPTLVEEVGEVGRALTLEQGDRLRLRAELVDTAAVCLMWIDSLDRGGSDAA